LVSLPFEAVVFIGTSFHNASASLLVGTLHPLLAIILLRYMACNNAMVRRIVRRLSIS
jgi:hypothetical protein